MRFVVLISVVIVIVLAVVGADFGRSSTRSSQVLEARMTATILPPATREFSLLNVLLGTKVVRPRITNVTTVDLENDQRAELLACDAVRHTVWWCRQSEGGQWKSDPLVPINTIAAPAHTATTDIDGDGVTDVVVAGLGHVWPTDDRIGQVVLLKGNAGGGYDCSVIADDVRRVTDVQPADLDADGDVDLAVAEFGYRHGRVFWLENLGDGSFADHRLLSLPGCIHVPIGDFDGDGDPDIAAVVSQNEEAVYIFENVSDGAFQCMEHKVWGTTNFDRGLAGMITCDLDRDGDTDLLLSAGDSLELNYPCPQPGHGCIWLENCGDFTFTAHEIGTLGGTYAAAVADLDADGDNDVVLASMFNNWRQAEATSLAWLENDGSERFTATQLGAAPTHLCTVTCGDFNGDGKPDIAAGQLQILPPYSHVESGLAVWTNLAEGNQLP